jgi:hypothetical protein
VKKRSASIDLDPHEEYDRGYRTGLEEMRDRQPTNVRKYFATMAYWFRQSAPHNATDCGELDAYREAAAALGLGEMLDLPSDCDCLRPCNRPDWFS